MRVHMCVRTGVVPACVHTCAWVWCLFVCTCVRVCMGVVPMCVHVCCACVCAHMCAGCGAHVCAHVCMCMARMCAWVWCLCECRAVQPTGTGALLWVPCAFIWGCCPLCQAQCWDVCPVPSSGPVPGHQCIHLTHRCFLPKGCPCLFLCLCRRLRKRAPWRDTLAAALPVVQTAFLATVPA